MFTKLHQLLLINVQC